MIYKDFDNGLDIDTAAEKFAESHDPEIVKEIFKKAQTADFLVPYRDKVNNIPIFSTEEKGKLFPAFSSFEAFEKSPLPKDKATIMPFSKIDEIITKSGGQINGIIINPHGRSMVFEKNAPGTTPNNPTEVKFMKPASVPATITAALHGYFTASQNVYAAYLLWAQKTNDLAPHLFLIIDFDGKAEEFFPKVAEAIRPCLSKGDNVEMAKADLKLLNAAEKLVKPFYKKP